MRILLVVLAVMGCCNAAAGQSVIQGDSVFLGVQPGKSSERKARARLGSNYRVEEIMGTVTAKLRDGGCVSSEYVAAVAMKYDKKGITVYVAKNERRPEKNNIVEGLDFDANSTIQSAKGIRPGQHTFADVIARYGSIDFDKKDNTTPKVQESSDDGEHWFTSLVFPTIQFRSAGPRQSGENLLLREVEVIRLEID